MKEIIQEIVNLYYLKFFYTNLVAFVKRTDIFRNHILDKIWIKCLEKKYIDLQSRVVVSDVRFINEAIWIQDMSGINVKVVRPNIWSNDRHASEQNIDNIKNIHYNIVNNTSIEDLYSKVDSMCDKYNIVKNHG